MSGDILLFFLHFFAFFFNFICVCQKKAVPLHRFWQMAHFGRVGEWLKPTVC